MKPYKFTEEFRRKMAKRFVAAGLVLVALGLFLVFVLARRL